MAENKTIGLNIKTNAVDVQKQFDDLRKEIKETTDAIEKLDKTSDTYEKDLLKLSKTLDGLNADYKSLSKSNR